jgi:FkbM family methyltransferase
VLRQNLFFLRRFSNASELIHSMRTGSPCGLACFRDGSRLEHPPDRGGLAPTLLEVLYEQCYTPPGFYRVAPGNIVVDAGANVGIFTFWAARNNPLGRVLALEPFPENFAFLERNIAFNRLAGVTACRAAIGATSGHGVMSAVGNRSLDHRLAPASQADAENVVPVLPLADVCGMADAEHIDLLKIDIEGGEYAAFENVDQSVLSRFRRIAVEYHDNIRPGSLALIQSRLLQTHRTIVHPDREGYGILLAQLRE